MTEHPITYSGVVHPWHCDAFGHMNVAWYVSKFDEATWCLFARLGISRAYSEREHRAMAAVEQIIHYKHELRPGDTVTVRSALLEVRDKVVRFRHDMVNNETGEVAAVTELTSVHFDTRARKSCPFPPVVAERLRAALEREDTGAA